MAEATVADAACSICGGRGWIVQPDGGAGKARPCDCRKRAVTQRLLEKSGIPERYQRCRVSNFRASAVDAPQLRAAKVESQRYLDTFLRPDGGFKESGLIFVGPPGVGKTHLAAAILSELISAYQVPGKFVDFTTLIHQIQATFDRDNPDSKQQVLEPVLSSPLLVLDELGAQKPTPWVRDQLYLIINTRYSRRLATLFTTNYPLEDAEPTRAAPSGEFGTDVPRGPESLSQRIPAPLVSRLCEMAKIVRLDSVEDFRRTVKMKSVGA